MRTLRTLTAVVLCVVALAQAESVLSKLKNAPDFTVRDVNGKQVTMKDLTTAGPAIVTFWSTWCVPCQAEIKHLSKYYTEYQAKGLSLLAVSLDGVKETAKVRQHVKSKKWNFTVVVDKNEQIKNAFNVVDVPTVFVIDKDGSIEYAHQGYVSGDEKKLKAVLEKLIQ